MFTRYVELYPVKSLMPMELAKVFYEDFILRHGIPEQVLLDNGRTFASQFNKELADMCKMELIFTPPYHAASNGMVEKFMKTLRTMLLLYTSQESITRDWDTNLKMLRFVYNNTYHASTQAIPFELVHGRVARTPLIQTEDVKLPGLYRNTTTPQRHFGEQLLYKLEAPISAVQESRKEHQPEDIKQYQLNEKVLLFNNQLSNTKKPRKLSFDWLGPLVVTEILSETRYNLKFCSNNKEVKNVHSTLIKPFFE